VPLSEVLKRAGVKADAKHVLFDGADVPVGKQPEFQRTIPISKAMAKETLLAYDMNGAALDIEHGFPLRVVVPGWAGDSWVKWVTRIEVLAKEFDGFFMKTGYRHPGKGVKPGQAVKPEEMRSVEEIQIKSVIAEIGPRTIGTAWSGESQVAAVEVSTDQGRTWKPARITSPKTPFGWVTWEFTWTPPEGYYVMMARARDAKGRTQPFTQEWNPSGYQWNVVHRRESDPAVIAAAFIAPNAPASFRASCVACHDETVMAQQRLTHTQWDAEIAKMERWGARVKPEDRAALIDYLVGRYGYRKR
jgi:DMSO/TMAO reductase YedYZ molybdopterin-dependent catalytic subunit